MTTQSVDTLAAVGLRRHAQTAQGLLLSQIQTFIGCTVAAFLTIWNKHRQILALHSIHPYITPYMSNKYTVQRLSKLAERPYTWGVHKDHFAEVYPSQKTR